MSETETPLPLRVGLVGTDIEDSLSPALHEREAQANGLAYTYELFDLDLLGLPPQAVSDVLKQARADGLRGLNVTHPCKQLAVAHVDALSREAEMLGAVNTVVFEPDRTVGHNTDWPGFAEAFQRGLSGVAVEDVVLLGAGGAGTAAAHAVLELGARRLHIADPDSTRAELLASTLGDADRVRLVTPAELASIVPRASGLVHATPTGMSAHPGIALDPGLLHRDMWVAEIVYRPLLTDLLRTAAELGCQTLDGGRMAVFQAARAFEFFTGTKPDAQRMLEHFAELTAEEESPWTRA